MDLNSEAEVLSRIPMFSMLDVAKLKLLAFTSDSLAFSPGELLFNAGDPSDCAYVILNGEIEILVQDKEGGLRPAFVRGKYELVGEMGIINDAPRSASIRAKGEVIALKITKEAFIKMLKENAAVALEVIKQLSVRLAQIHSEYESLRSKTSG